MDDKKNSVVLIPKEAYHDFVVKENAEKQPKRFYPG